MKLFQQPSWHPKGNFRSFDFWFVGTAISLMMIVWGAVFTVVVASAADPGTDLKFFFGLVALYTVVWTSALVRFQQVGILLDSDGVRVRNFWVSTAIPWSRVARFAISDERRFFRAFCAQVILVDGKVVHSTALHEAADNVRHRLTNTPAMQMVEELNLMATRRQANQL